MKFLIGPNPMGLEKAIPDFERDYPQADFVHCADRGAIIDAIADADVYVGWLNREIFLAAKKLKWVQSPSSGINYYLAIPEFVESDVLLTSARGTHGACLAESVLAMIMAFTRGIKDCILAQQTHKWAVRSIRPKLRAPSEPEDHDFVIQEDLPGFVNLIGIESPGLTAAPAIADRVRAILTKYDLVHALIHG